MRQITIATMSIAALLIFVFLIISQSQIIVDISQIPVRTSIIRITFKRLVEIMYCSLMIITAVEIPTSAVEARSQ